MSLFKENLRYQALLFLFTPILGLLYGLKSKSLKTIRWSIFTFTVIYGTMFNYEFFGGSGSVEGGADGVRYLDTIYKHYMYLDFSVWFEELKAILILAPKSTTNDDVFVHVISYLAGGVFNAPNMLYFFVAIVYGYFYSGVIVKIFSYINWNSKNNRFYLFYFLIFLILFKNPGDMQTIRSWTGMWVLIYAILSYHETKKKKYLLLAFVPPFIHVMYFVISIPIWLVLLSGFKRPKFYFIVFVISILVSNVVEQTNALSYMSSTQLGASKSTTYYTDEDELAERQEEISQNSASFYKKYEQLRIHYYVMSAFIIFIFFILRNRGFGAIENTLFSYGLALASFANFSSSIFALYSRTWQVACIMILSLIVIFLSKQDLKSIRLSFLRVKIPLIVFTIVLFPYLLFKLSSFLDFTSVYALFLPFVSWISPEVGISLKNVIKIFI